MSPLLAQIIVRSSEVGWCARASLDVSCIKLGSGLRSSSSDVMFEMSTALLPIISHNFLNLSNVANIVRYLYGRTHM